MSWTRKALKNYSNEIRKLYEIPLTERCFGKFDESKNSTEVSVETSDSRTAAKDLAKKLEKGSNVTETFTDLALITKRVADALANPTKDFIENRAETPRHLITPIEIASLSRLRTLVKMSGSWLKKTVEMEAWMEKNQKVLIQNATEISCALEFAIMAFNAVCILGEIYGLEPVDRKSVKKDFIRYLQPYERPRLKSYNSKLDIPENVKVFEYIGKLEAILNHH
uniref:Uncharacterized protein n=1 Tax=Panagrolaimus sp. PS1159 TaxID=55785 RepID=A0AC35EWV5_9BILA